MLMRDIDLAFYLSNCHIQFAKLTPNTINYMFLTDIVCIV